MRYDTFKKNLNSTETKPDEVVSPKQEWSADDGSKFKFVDKLLKDYKITNYKTHYYTKSTDIDEW